MYTDAGKVWVGDLGRLSLAREAIVSVIDVGHCITCIVLPAN